MRILSINSGHDGSVAYVDNGVLIFSIEAEKDSHPRHSNINADIITQALEMASDIPDVVAVGGWHSDLSPSFRPDMYFGARNAKLRDGHLFGNPAKYFTSSHERSHIYMAAAMSPDAPLQECLILVWEGVLGAFYHWRDHGREISRFQVLSDPGSRYAALFAIADPTFPEDHPTPRISDAGKLMALAGYADGIDASGEDRLLVEHLINDVPFWPFDKRRFKAHSLYNSGINSSRMHNCARYITDRIFQIYFDFARLNLPKSLPLVISGGCGLNCEWNRRWLESGLFSSVFVPPCANDSGSVLGTAVDAQVQLGGDCRLIWDVYSGAPFILDYEPDPDAWERKPIVHESLAERMVGGSVIAWVQGRAEIGPRALGHRSLLASPLSTKSKTLLNRLKGRESYRPIAPCCLQEDLDKYFDFIVDDPYMLFFSRVRVSTIPAVTHADGTARVQSVKRDNNTGLYSILSSFRNTTGCGVLCNTSLNFPGRGFINRMSDLFAYCEDRHISDIVVDNEWFQRRFQE